MDQTYVNIYDDKSKDEDLLYVLLAIQGEWLGYIHTWSHQKSHFVMQCSDQLIFVFQSSFQNF